MKSLQLIKATVVKNAVIAISIYYAITLAFLIFAIFIMHQVGFDTDSFLSMVVLSQDAFSQGVFSQAAFSGGGNSSLLLFIFALLSIQYMFKFSQNVCVSRKTCFISAIYTILVISIIMAILDMLIVFFAKIVIGYDVNDLFLTVLVYISICIVDATCGMLVGIVWYRLSKFAKICLGIAVGILCFVAFPVFIVFVAGIMTGLIDFPTWIIDVGTYLYKLFYTGDIWTVLANIGLAAVLSGIFYLVIRKAEIKELK